jgi:hypothetical protein
MLSDSETLSLPPTGTAEAALPQKSQIRYLFTEESTNSSKTCLSEQVHELILLAVSLARDGSDCPSI